MQEIVNSNVPQPQRGQEFAFQLPRAVQNKGKQARTIITEMKNQFRSMHTKLLNR
jgi:hypothetical protein